MNYQTVKAIVDNETGECFPFTLCGVVMPDFIFDDFLEHVSKDVLEELSQKYIYVSTTYVLGYPNGYVIIGKFIDDLDATKSINDMKSEIMDDFLKYKLVKDNNIVTKGVDFIGGVQIDDVDEDMLTMQTEENKKQQAQITEAIKKERGEL